MSRTLARKNAFKLLYERQFHSEQNEITFDLMVSEVKKEAEYITAIYNGVNSKLALLSHTIDKYSNGFTTSRSYKVDFAILLLASYEILYIEEIDDKVSVSEAISIAKEFSGDKSAKFINGVLATVIKNAELINSEEFLQEAEAYYKEKQAKEQEIAQAKEKLYEEKMQVLQAERDVINAEIMAEKQAKLERKLAWEEANGKK